MFSAKKLVALATAAGVDLDVAEQHAPLLALIAAAQPPAPVSSADALEASFDLWKSYTTAEAAAILGLGRAKTLYDIDEHELPRVRVGPTRTAVRFFGLDLLCYMRGLPLVDWRAVRDDAEAQVHRAKPDEARPAMRALPGTGRRRVQ